MSISFFYDPLDISSSLPDSCLEDFLLSLFSWYSQKPYPSSCSYIQSFSNEVLILAIRALAVEGSIDSSFFPLEISWSEGSFFISSEGIIIWPESLPPLKDSFPHITDGLISRIATPSEEAL